MGYMRANALELKLKDVYGESEPKNYFGKDWYGIDGCCDIILIHRSVNAHLITIPMSHVWKNYSIHVKS
jgi:hypothetical protein